MPSEGARQIPWARLLHAELGRIRRTLVTGFGHSGLLESEAGKIFSNALEVWLQRLEAELPAEQPVAQRRGPIYPIPPEAEAAYCKGCDDRIYWVQTPAGRPMPVNPDGSSHWGTCPKAGLFRRERER
jgi:hypothetical protein